MVEAPTDETDPELAAQVRDQAAQLPNVELLSRRPRAQLLDEITRAVAVVSTSRIEGMPNVFLEAWARSVPVLSLHVDPDAQISDKGLGIWADGSTERFIAGARALLSDRRLRDEIGERARRFVRDVHSPEVVTDRWAALLHELLPELTP